jgi:hypothetical protein
MFILIRYFPLMLIHLFPDNPIPRFLPALFAEYQGKAKSGYEDTNDDDKYG